MPYYNPWERFADPFRRYRRLEAAVGGVLESPDVVLVPLLTTVPAQWRFPWSDGVVKPPALAETVAALAALKDDPRHKLVIAHHPLLGPDDARANPTIGGDAAFAALAAAGADAALSGHIHVPLDEMRMRGGTAMRMIGAGTLSTRLRHGAPPSYRVITCELGEPITSELRIIT
jgi:3',5'-cyclic AMP phosphodiesterase CpdA